jgi:HD domain
VCEQLHPRFLVNHSYRTYVWAAIVAAHERLEYDEEVVYVASLLHDTGLSDAHQIEAPPNCFSLIGAEAAVSCAADGGWDRARRDMAAEAIVMHLNLRVRPVDGIEAYLTAAGTSLDAVGARWWLIDPATRDAVLERYPRRGVKEGFVERFRSEAKTHPGSRAQYYWRYLALRRRLRVAPFEE